MDLLRVEDEATQQRVVVARIAQQGCAAESAAGLELTISAGAEIHGENVEPAIRAAVSTRDDLIVNGVLLANSRLVVAVRNTTAGALDLFFRIVLDPL